MTDKNIDTSWIPLLINGDRKAITYFVEEYGGFMYNVCYKILLSTPDAEEASQDAMMKIVNSISKFDPTSSIKAWCYTIAYRTAIDHQRKQKKNHSLELVSEFPVDGKSDDEINRNETAKSIQDLLRHLDEESRTIISLYYLEEKNIKEVMQITALSESNIKIKLFRARKELVKYAPKYLENLTTY